MAAAQTQEKRIRVVVDTAALQASAKQANGILAQIGQGGSLNGLNTQFQALGSNAASAATKIAAANDNLHGTAAAASHASGGILEMVKHLGSMTLALAGIGFLTAGIHELAEAFIESANEATEVASRLTLVTNGSKEFAAAQANVASIASSTRASLTDVAELYQKIGLQAAHLGASQSDVTTMTRTFAETLKVSGSTTQQAQAAMRQLGEAFDQNTLSGRHFMAMQMDNIRFMQLLASSMGVSQGKLKELSTDGKVTGEALKTALTDPTLASGLQKQFDKMPVGFADVRMAIKNTLVQLAGDFMDGAGLNGSLRSLYDNIAGFADSAKPAFEKIGVAFRAAVSTFAPLISGALAVIKPFFGFILDNAPTLIQLTKVGAEAWIAYRVAMSSVMALNFASFLTTELASLALLIRTAQGGGVGMSFLKAGFEAAAGGLDMLTAAIAANPVGFLVVGVTAALGLLYEFRDSIKISGDGVTSFGDLVRAIFEDIGPAISTAADTIRTAFSGTWASVQSALGSVGTFLYSAFSGPLDGIKTLWASTFGDLPLSFEGVVTGAARMLDLLTGMFRGELAAIQVVWAGLPEALGIEGVLDTGKALISGIGSMIASVYNSITSFGSAIGSTIASVFNGIGDFIEKWANRAIDLVNSVLTGANKLGASFTPLAAVHIGKIELPHVDTTGLAKLGQTAGEAYAAGFGHTAEDGVKSLFARAHAIGAARTKTTPAITPGASATTPAAEDEDGKKDKAAEKRAKQEKEFWQTLQNELDTSKLFGIEAQKVTKEQALQKILGRDLVATEKERVDSMVQNIANSKAVTSLKQAEFDISNKNMLLQQRATGLTADQAKIEDALDAQRLTALNSGADINSKDYQTWLAKYRTALQLNQALEKINTAMATAKKYSTSYSSGNQLADIAHERDDFIKAFNSGKLTDPWGDAMTTATRDGVLKGMDQAVAEIKNTPIEIVAKAGSITAQAELDRRSASTTFDNAKDAITASGMSPSDQAKALKEVTTKYSDDMLKANRLVADNFSNQMISAIDALAELFGGKMGKAIKGVSTAIENMMSTANGDNGLATLANTLGTKFGDGFKEGAANVSIDKIGDGIKNIGNTFSDLKKGFDPSQGGSFLKGMGAAVGGAMQGYQIGGAVGGLENALGLKHSETGAKIGGAIGGLTGNPAIAAAASVVGGLISSVLHKTKTGGATITGGDASDITLSGNSATFKKAAQGLAGDVQSGLADIASKLGGSVGNFSGITIGQRHGDYRVNESGTSLKKDKGAVDFNDDEDGAIQYAITLAVRKGALTGLSDLAQKAVAGMDIDTAISFVQQWNSVMADFKSITDPIGAAVQAVIDPLKTMRDTMVTLGASTEDLTKLDQYREAKLNEVLKSSLSSLTSFTKTLNGDGSGVTQLSQLNADLAEFKSYQTKIKAGDSSIDQSDFTALGQEIFALAKDVYGTATGQFQDIRAALLNATSDLATNVTNAFNTASGNTPASTATDTTTAAIQAQTSAIVGQQVIMTDYLKQIAANTNTTTATTTTSTSTKASTSLNGAYTGRLV